jgi:hypothetical protein
MAYTVQGNPHATRPEWMVAQALEKHHMVYLYQFRLFQPAGVRGEVRVDFIIRTPLWTPLEVFGEYWHSGQLAADDRLRLHRIAREFRRAECPVIWGNQCETAESTEQALRRLGIL